MNKDVRVGLYGGSYIHFVECEITHLPDACGPELVVFEYMNNTSIVIPYNEIEHIVHNWKEKEIT